MRGTTALLALSLFAVGCGGESENDASGGSGGATGGSGGAGGSTGGAGGSGGSAGSGGTAGAGGGSGGSTGGTGGAGATGGSGGSTGGTGGTGGAGPAQPECKIDGDCKMFSDCCSCMGVPTTENPVPCPANCLQDKCGELSAPKTAACIAGRCVAGFNCDSSKVTCKMATPNCDPGKVPLVKEDGTCWQGSCVPANECKGREVVRRVHRLAVLRELRHPTGPAEPLRRRPQGLRQRLHLRLLGTQCVHAALRHLPGFLGTKGRELQLPELLARARVSSGSPAKRDLRASRDSSLARGGIRRLRR
jgi:hypothetical protein